MSPVLVVGSRTLGSVTLDLDALWIVLAAVLVMFMQAGFACVEIGFSRGKNAGAVVAKVLLNFSVVSLVWWACGFALAFGGGGLLLGDSGFFLHVGQTLSPGSPIAGPVTPADTGYVSGWVVEQYQIDLVAAAERARVQMEGQTRRLCSAQVPGDTQRNLQVDADFSKQTFKHVLLPLWIVAYTYGSRTFQVLVNGSTGRIAGKYPYSWIKIAFAIFCALIALLILAWLKNN